MNKKGFTLLELLAVIVVLAIIALIVTPFVTKAIDEAKKGAFKDSSYGVMVAAEIYYMKNLSYTEYSSAVINIIEGVTSESEFSYKGKKIDTLHLEIDEKGKISM